MILKSNDWRIVISPQQYVNLLCDKNMTGGFGICHTASNSVAFIYWERASCRAPRF